MLTPALRVQHYLPLRLRCLVGLRSRNAHSNNAAVPGPNSVLIKQGRTHPLVQPACTSTVAAPRLGRMYSYQQQRLQVRSGDLGEANEKHFAQTQEDGYVVALSFLGYNHLIESDSGKRKTE